MTVGTKKALKERRRQLLEQIALAADSIAKIDARLEIMRNQVLEEDLKQAERIPAHG
jgi:hypothetical protein